MPQPLDPDDRPPDSEFAVADPADAIRAFGPPSWDNPAFVALTFWTEAIAVHPNVSHLRQLVTPESLLAWGDFSSLREFFGDLSLTSKCTPAVGDPDVVYAKFVDADEIYPEGGDAFQLTTDAVVGGRAVATLVRRRDLGGWRVHQVGEYLRPEQVPHG